MPLLAMINISQEKINSLTPNPSPKEMGVIRLEGVERVKG